MSSRRYTELKLNVRGVGEKSGRPFIRVDCVPHALAPYMKDSGTPRDSAMEVHLYYVPFLGEIEAIEGDNVPFQFETETGKLLFAPSPELYAVDTITEITIGPSLLHRFYKINKRKEDTELYWCAGITNDKKKPKAILLDVTRFISSTLSLDEEPNREAWPGSELYCTMKISKLRLALPKRYVTSRGEPHPSRITPPRSPRRSPDPNSPIEPIKAEPEDITAHVSFSVSRDALPTTVHHQPPTHHSWASCIAPEHNADVPKRPTSPRMDGSATSPRAPADSAQSSKSKLGSKLRLKLHDIEGEMVKIADGTF